jgi:hypothetical protein
MAIFNNYFFPVNPIAESSFVAGLPAVAIDRVRKDVLLSKISLLNQFVTSSLNLTDAREYSIKNTQESLKVHTKQETVQAKSRTFRASEIMLRLLSNFYSSMQVKNNS